MKNYQLLSMNQPVYTPSAMLSPEFTKAGGAATEGVRIPVQPFVVPDALPDSDPQKKPALEFHRIYLEEYKAPAMPFGGPATDAFKLAVDAIERAGSTDKARVLGSTHAEHLSHCATLSVAWQPGLLATPPLAQIRAYWHHWFMATARGQAFVREHGKAIAREKWDLCSPSGWFDDAGYEAVARSFANPDWAEIPLHSYQVRWQEAEPVPRYATLAAAQVTAGSIDVPTLMIQGDRDGVALPELSEGKEKFHTAGYERHLLAGVGHFPTREAPAQVAALLVDLLARW